MMSFVFYERESIFLEAITDTESRRMITGFFYRLGCKPLVVFERMEIEKFSYELKMILWLEGSVIGGKEPSLQFNASHRSTKYQCVIKTYVTQIIIFGASRRVAAYRIIFFLQY